MFDTRGGLAHTWGVGVGTTNTTIADLEIGQNRDNSSLVGPMCENPSQVDACSAGGIPFIAL